jgi:thiamine-phosphate pyrophosphorylase
MENFLHYLITDPKYYGDDIEKFKDLLKKSLDRNNIDIASFRDKQSIEIKELANIFLQTCKQHHIQKTIINSNIEIALELGFDGVHLTSKQFDKIEFCISNNLYTIISCHDFNEVKKAYELGANAITFSPIFYTPYKGKPKGIEALKALIKQVKQINKRDFKVIGLGGIVDEEHISQIKETKADGFASIRYFIS